MGRAGQVRSLDATVETELVKMQVLDLVRAPCSPPTPRHLRRGTDAGCGGFRRRSMARRGAGCSETT
eukprot:2668472-Rhodomonas_salina.2